MSDPAYRALESRKKDLERAKKWNKDNPDKVRAASKKYRTTEKGKAARLRQYQRRKLRQHDVMEDNE